MGICVLLQTNMKSALEVVPFHLGTLKYLKGKRELKKSLIDDKQKENKRRKRKKI